MCNHYISICYIFLIFSSLRQEHRGIHFDPFCLRETMAGGTADATADAIGDSLGIYPEQNVAMDENP